MTHQASPAALPLTGYVRQADILGQAPVSSAQAEANRAAGKTPCTPRPGRLPLVPISSATLWRKVNSGEFPRPVKLSERCTAWRVEDIRAWMAARI